VGPIISVKLPLKNRIKSGGANNFGQNSAEKSNKKLTGPIISVKLPLKNRIKIGGPIIYVKLPLYALSLTFFGDVIVTLEEIYEIALTDSFVFFRNFFLFLESHFRHKLPFVLHRRMLSGLQF